MIESSAWTVGRADAEEDAPQAAPLESDATDPGVFPEASLERLIRAIQSFEWVSAVLPEDERLRAEVMRRFDFVVAQMACAEREAGLVFSASPQIERVEWKWWQDKPTQADPQPSHGGSGDAFEPLRRGQPATVTLTVRRCTPQLVFALRQLLWHLPPEDIQVCAGPADEAVRESA